MNKWTLMMPAMFPIELMRKRTLRAMFSALDSKRALTPATRVVEVGCGIGTVLTELARYGCQLVGVDPNAAMLWVARRRLPNAVLLQEPAHAMRSLPDLSQNVSFVCSVLHGLEPEYRRRVYAELRRVTRELVVVIDYRSNHNPMVTLTEWIEGGDYFRFVKVVEQELAGAFRRLEVIRFPGYEALYLCWTR